MRLAFVGRRSLYDTARRVTFQLSLYGPGDLVIADAAARAEGHVRLSCSDYPCVASTLFREVPRLLGEGGRLGIDLGAARNGLAYVWRGVPLLHAVVGWSTLREILESRPPAEIYVGASPHLARVWRSLCGARVVDEVDAGRARPWLRRRYPQLAEDEVDALSFTLAGGIGSSCR